MYADGDDVDGDAVPLQQLCQCEEDDIDAIVKWWRWCFFYGKRTDDVLVDSDDLNNNASMIAIMIKKVTKVSMVVTMVITPCVVMAMMARMVRIYLCDDDDKHKWRCPSVIILQKDEYDNGDDSNDGSNVCDAPEQ